MDVKRGFVEKGCTMSGWRALLKEVDSDLQGIGRGLNVATQEALSATRAKLNRLWGFFEGRLEAQGSTNEGEYRKHFPKIFEIDDDGPQTVLRERVPGDDGQDASNMFCPLNVYDELINTVIEIVMEGQTFDRRILTDKARERVPNVVWAATLAAMHLWISEDDPLIVKDTQTCCYSLNGVSGLNPRNAEDRKELMEICAEFREDAHLIIDELRGSPRRVESPRSPVESV